MDIRQNLPEMPPQITQALANAEQLGGLVSAVGTQIFNKVSAPAIDTATRVSEVAADSAHSALEQTTESVGETLSPIAENPAVDYVAKVPGLGWLTSALGRVDKAAAVKDVAKLKAKHPDETAEDLAHRVIVDTTIKAGGVGLATNIIPPLALGLFAIDIAAVSALQSEMLYRIAAIYGFDVSDPTRKGEALTIFTASLSASTAMKTGLSAVELIPIVGAAVGASGNAGILYSFGIAASEFYKRKRSRANRAAEARTTETITTEAKTTEVKTTEQ
ncbi:MAG: EcsC family protein [Cyanobacteria bacterium J06614_10]